MNNTKTDTIRMFFPESVGTSWLGGLNYYVNLFTALKTVTNPKIEPFIFPPEEDAGSVLEGLSKTLAVKKTPLYYAQKKIFYPLLHKSFDIKEYALSHTHIPIDAVSHTDISANCPLLLWIADFQHVHLSQMFSEKQLKEREMRLKDATERADIVILSSFDALADFKKLYPARAEKGRVLHFVAIPEENIYEKTDAIKDAVLQKYRLPPKYFFVPNQFWKHKNHKTVFEAVALLKKRGVDVHVVFSGNTVDGRNPDYFPALMAYAKEANIEENIRILGIIERLELFYLMRNCVSIINPSLFEGWSSTVEEAKSLGKNIILSDLPVHREQNPPAAQYFNPHNAEELASIMEQTWKTRESSPDLLLEQNAKNALTDRIHEFGSQYQQIALEAIARGKAKRGKK